MAESDLIISCQWLKDRILAGRLPENAVILDVSWASDKDMEKEYLKGHIPGARYFCIMDNNHTEMYPRNVPSAENFQKRAREAGINNESHLILYSNSHCGGFFISGRAWWTFKYFGHNNISVLDGGWEKWIEENGDFTTDVPDTVNGNFTVKLRSDVKISFDDMSTFVKTNSRQIIDSRATDKYGPDTSTHVQGAINIPLSSLVDSNTLKSKDELRKIFSTNGIDINEPVTCYCNSGMSSCSLVLAVETCGGQGTLYSGGFNEWKRKNDQAVVEK